MLSVGEDVEKGTHIAGGNVNWTLLVDSLLVYSKIRMCMFIDTKFFA